MNELIESLLDWVREGTLRIDVVTLRETVEACWQNVHAPQSTLTVETDRVILADENQLRQLLENLLRNAVEHGGTRIEVGDVTGGFYLEDDGSGIPEGDRENVLEDGFSTSADGTGLGLGIVAEVVANHEWDLTVAEGTEGGARFEITSVDLV